MQRSRSFVKIVLLRMASNLEVETSKAVVGLTGFFNIKMAFGIEFREGELPYEIKL